MFSKSGWFAIGPDNKRLAGVVIPNLEAGLRLLDEPDAHLALVGRLRPGLVVVDIDVPGDRGWLIAEQVTGWATQRGLWTLARPSGGADGRTHVFVAVGPRLDDLIDLVAGIRRHHGYGKNLVDVRDTVRPLSSPHRATGRRTLPLALTGVAAVRVQLRLLEAALRVAPTRLPRRPGQRRATGPAATALVPRPRPRTPLPPEWEHYLETAERPVLRGEDQSRSVYELAATTAMVRAGHTVDTAWDLVMTAHPDAMSKARADRRRWVAWIWNHVVTATEHDTTQVADPEVEGGLATAVDLLEERLWQLPSVRRRPAVRAVAVAVFNRMRREGKLRVPCPERCLLTDTGIKDRETVRNALRDLHGYVGILHQDTFNPLDPYTSYEFEILPDPDRGMLVNHPPSSHDPLRPGRELHGLDLRGQMLRAALATAALGDTNPLSVTQGADQVTHEGLSLTQVAQRAVLTKTPDGELSTQQARTLAKDLEGLALAGWAVCDSRGRWTVSEPDPASEATQRARQETFVEREQLAARVAQERAVYRRNPRCAWEARRHEVLEQVRARADVWWASLSSAERADRAQRAADAFACLSPADQARRKHAWAAARAAAGVSETDRHQAWLTSLSVDELVARAEARAAWYWNLPAQQRREYVQAWDAHRQRHQVPRAHIDRPKPGLLVTGAA